MRSYHFSSRRKSRIGLAVLVGVGLLGQACNNHNPISVQNIPLPEENMSAGHQNRSEQVSAALPSFVLVPAGTFMMGDGVSYCGGDEHLVTLTRDFYLGQYETTNIEFLEAAQWAYDNGYVTIDSIDLLDALDGSTTLLLELSDKDCEIQFNNGIFSLRDAGHGINPNHPVIESSWYGSVAYCDWLSMQNGLPRAYDHANWECNGGDPYGAVGYRLPTSAEWEYAARFGDDRIYPWGNEEPVCSLANFLDDLNYCVSWTSPVGSYPGGPFINGVPLYDMAGNVWEKCNDRWECDLGTSPQTDPVGPAVGIYRVAKGGSWLRPLWALRCAARFDRPPGGTHPPHGFRIARTDLTPVGVPGIGNVQP